MCELLAPAGSYESIRAAINAGADAVYAGGRRFGARAYADNPDEEHLIRGIEYCHLHSRKLYLTVNTLLKERELEEALGLFLAPLYEAGADGLIVQDFGVMRYVRERFPGLPVHASTQMTVTGPEGVRLLQSEGVTRAVLARELSLDEIRTIIEETGAETETFIHGAMCYSYSGQCLLSSMLGGRSGNRGRCAQPCRLPFRLLDRGSAEPSFLLSMKDMCALDLLPDLVDAGIASLKIEGRMKRPEYTAGVVSIYRKYLDRYRDFGRDGYRVDREDRTALLDLYNRGGFSAGYYRVKNGKEMMSMCRPNHMGTPAVRISVGKGGKLKASALEPLGRGDVIELAPGREFTLARDIPEGAPFALPDGKESVKAGSILFRTKNAGLYSRIREQYLEQDRKVKISGVFLASAGRPVILRLSCGNVGIECAGWTAESALSQSSREDGVRRQLQKTGGTVFEFAQLDIRLEGELFLPVGRLNELRRNALELLEREITARGRRKAVPFAGAQEGQRPALPEREKGASEKFSRQRRPVNVLVTSEEQLDALFADGCEGIDTVYLDSLLSGPAGGPRRLRDKAAQLKERGCRCFLSCPPVLRGRDREFFVRSQVRELMMEMDGFLVHTLDGLVFFRDFIRENRLPAVLAADSSLYAYNRRAAAFLRGCGAERITLPAELNHRELAALGGKGTELEVYGRQALMQSAQCVLKNTSGCTGIPAVTYLKDRRNMVFPVLSRCPSCCNTVYNSVPLMLCGCEEEIERIAPEFLRLSFTVESGEETARILRRMRLLLAAGGGPEISAAEGTRGHFKRGVE